MRIKKVVARNYRQFRDFKHEFHEGGKDIHLLLGVMATGKTNFLNAVNWCFYGEEPNLSKKSQQLPRVNLNTIKETPKGEKREVTVELWTELADRRSVSFTRTEQFALYGVGKDPVSHGESLEIKIIDHSGNARIIEGDDAQQLVERFVPRGIRDFFFFDGERLDKYFREATGQRIRNAIFRISQTDTLERMQGNLDRIRRELRQKAGKESPQIEMTRSDLEDLEKRIAEVDDHIMQVDNQIAKARDCVGEYGEKLQGIPDIRPLQDKKKRLEERRKGLQDSRDQKEREKQELLLEYGRLLLLYPAIDRMEKVIREKRRKNEIPPTIDRGLLTKILDSEMCLCDRPVSRNSPEEEAIRRIENEVKVSSEVAKELLRLESAILIFAQQARGFAEELAKLRKDIFDLSNVIESIENDIQEINKTVGGYKDDEIKEWYLAQQKWERVLSESLEKRGGLKTKRAQLVKSKDETEKRLERELKREKKVRQVRRELQFVRKALEVVERSKNDVMDRIRRAIAKRTRELFFQLIWRKHTYKDVFIDDNYNIHVIHDLGYEALGTLSGGEREVLALSFTLALHDVSGFDAPIVVDRPLAMVSGDPIEYVVQALIKIGEKRQMTLLMTPDDYSQRVRVLLEAECSTRGRLLLHANENEAKLEEL
jgi:DNA sulfur modification protein DndD